MSRTVRPGLVPAVLLLAALPLHAQTTAPQDRPTADEPLRPSTRQELDRVEARKLYGLALLHERKNHLLRATELLEEALRLDPEAAPVCRALIPLYLALDRVEDSLTVCRKALELNPDDYETGYRYARQLRALDRPKEALAALRRAAGSPGLKERPDQRAQIFFDLAAAHENAGDLVRAEQCFREVARTLDDPAPLVELGPYSRDEINAQAAETCERLGRVCLRAGAPDRAVEAFRQAQKKDPSRAARLAYNLAEVFKARGAPGPALDSLEEYLRTRPQGTEAYKLKAELQRRLGREREVVPSLEAAVRRDPHNTGLKLLLAAEYGRAGRGNNAERLYNAVAAEAPGPEVYRGLFELYKRDGQLGGSRALTTLNVAVARAAGDGKRAGDPGEATRARAMLQVLRDDADMVRLMLPVAEKWLIRGSSLAYQTRLLLGALAARTHLLDGAEKMYRSCLDRPAGRRGDEQEIYTGLLRVLARAHKYEAILEVCNRGLKTAGQTNRVVFHLELAEAHLALDHAREALAASEAAVNESLPGSRLFCRIVRARVLSQVGKHDAAVAECLALLREYNQPGDVRDIRQVLAAAHLAAGRHEKSEEQLALILRSDPNDATANNNLGFQWAERNVNLEQAEHLIRKAIDLDRKQHSSGTALGADADEDNAAYVDSLGWVLFRRGRYEEARKELERASTMPGGDDDPVVWDHLGDTYFRLRQGPRAAAAWRKALALYDARTRHRDGDRYREIGQKLRLLGPQR